MLSHELAGAGRPVVLLHAGVCDSRMWDPQWRPFSAGHRVVRFDFAGFGLSPLEPGRICHAEDVIALLDALGIERAALVGASFGARVALELAVARPERVSSLVLACPGMIGHDWSEAVRAYGAEEDAALERGDLHAAVEANLRMWVDGPHRLSAAVDPALREAVGRMQRRAFEHWLALPEDARDALDEGALVPELPERLGEIAVPTLILLGELDVADMHEIAGRVHGAIRGARLVRIPETAHLPSLEVPGEFNELVLDFLVATGWGQPGAP